MHNFKTNNNLFYLIFVVKINAVDVKKTKPKTDATKDTTKAIHRSGWVGLFPT